jgi:3-oxoacyl-[acyl-carrier protein] reductase
VNRYDVEGRLVVVTGGAGGIGRAIARAALANGARVSLWDRRPDGLAEASRELAGSARLALRTVDVTNAAHIDEALALDAAWAGRIDAFVNNAGILGQVCPLWETDPADFRRVLDVNLFGTYLCLRAALQLMRGQAPQPSRGRIVNVASIQGKEGMSLAGAYSASKAAVIALTKSAGKEVAREAIVVNCVAPAAAETAMAAELTAERRAELLGRIPMGRFARVDEIAAMVLFLCSDECSFSTGAVFDLSGGRATY